MRGSYLGRQLNSQGRRHCSRPKNSGRFSRRGTVTHAGDLVVVEGALAVGGLGGDGHCAEVCSCFWWCERELEKEKMRDRGREMRRARGGD